MLPIDLYTSYNVDRQWLTKTEDRISRMGALRGSSAHVAAQLAAASALAADLRAQQPAVDALADCVVVVDDDANDNCTHFPAAATARSILHLLEDSLTFHLEMIPNITK